MKTRFRLTRRGSRGDKFYCVDNKTGKRTSLNTSDATAARQIVEAKNQAECQPVLNLQIAKAYLAGADSGFKRRTWQDALEALTAMKQGANQKRWRTVAKDRALGLLFTKVIPLAPKFTRVSSSREASPGNFSPSPEPASRPSERS